MTTPEDQLIDAYADMRCPDPDGDHTNGCEAANTARRLIRAIKSQVWEEGAESAFYEPEIRGQVDYPDNPYEEQS